MPILLPLRFDKQQRFLRDDDISASVREFLNLIVATPCGSCELDTDFGFIFKNFRFQNFNEEKAVLFSTSGESDGNKIHINENPVHYSWKIHGRSVNAGTFAQELKKSIETYEPRLRQVRVAMDYKRQEHMLNIRIEGRIGEELLEPFTHQIRVHVW